MTGDRTIEYYQKRAAEYEKVYFRDNPERQVELAALYALSQETLANRKVLDIACGTGFWTRIVADKAESMIGLDINPATLTIALAKKYSCPAEFILGDIFHLPVLPQECDAVLATYILSHIKRQDIEPLGGLLRAVVPSGSPIFLCDNNLICEMIPDLIWDEQHIDSYKLRRLENGEEFLILKNYFEKDELVSRLETWGRITEIVYKEYYWAVTLTTA